MTDRVDEGRLAELEAVARDVQKGERAPDDLHGELDADAVLALVACARRYYKLRSAAIRYGVGGTLHIGHEDGEWAITGSDFEPFAFGETFDAVVDALRAGGGEG